MKCFLAKTNKAVFLCYNKHVKTKFFLFCMFFIFSLSYSRDFLPVRGVDLSFLSELEEKGVVFKDTAGKPIGDLISFLRDEGANCVRIRLWIENPANQDSHCTLAETKKMALRIKAAGMKFLLDFHFSHTWADPSNQLFPENKTWQEALAKYGGSGLSKPEKLKIFSEEVFEPYIRNVLEELNLQDTAPDIIQVGNEISNGFLHPLGRIDYGGENPFGNLGFLLARGIKTARECCPGAEIMLHLDCSSDLEKTEWWLENVTEQLMLYGIDFDSIGFSYYSVWHGQNLEQIGANLKEIIDEFKKPVYIVETAYPWTLDWKDKMNNIYGEKKQLIKKFPAEKNGQREYFEALCKMVAEFPGGYGRGVFWWEPDYISFPEAGFYSSMENLTWFDFDRIYNGTGAVFKRFR